MPTHSLRSRIVLATVLLTMLCFGITMVTMEYLSKYDDRREAITQARIQKEAMAMSVRYHFRLIEDDIKVMVTNAGQHVVKETSMAQRVAGVLQTNHTIHEVGVAYVPGVGIEAGKRLMVGCEHTADSTMATYTHTAASAYNYLDKTWYKEALSNNGNYWSEPYRTNDGDGCVVITYACPVSDAAGRVYAVALADVSLASIAYGLNMIKPHEGSYTMMLTPKGHVLSVNDTMSANVTYKDVVKRMEAPMLEQVCLSMLAGREGDMLIKVRGEECMVSFCKVTDTPWSICTITPYSEITSEKDWINRIMLAGLLLAMLSMIASVALLMRRLLRPLEELTAAVGSFKDGEFQRALPATNISEVNRLVESFEHMQANLHNYMTRLTEETRRKQSIESELHFAGKIQTTLLPHNFHLDSAHHIDLHAYLQPARQVGGDFYDFHLRNDKLYFAIADVSGKGMPAALFMCVARTLFCSALEHTDSAADIARNMNSHLCQGNDAMMFATAIIGVLHLSTRQLTYCNAGHNPFVVIDGQGAAFDERESCTLLGFDPNATYHEHTLTLQPQQTLLLYTDGLNEAEDEERRQFGNEALLSAAAGLAGQPSEEVIAGIKRAVYAHIGKALQSDDLTLLSIRL